MLHYWKLILKSRFEFVTANVKNVTLKKQILYICIGKLYFSLEVLNSLLSDLAFLDIIKCELCGRKVSLMSDTGCAYFSLSAKMESSTIIMLLSKAVRVNSIRNRSR